MEIKSKTSCGIMRTYNLRPRTLSSSSAHHPSSRNRSDGRSNRRTASDKKFKPKHVSNPKISNRIKKPCQNNTLNNDNQTERNDPPSAEEEDIKCSICFDTENDSNIETLECGHTFHSNCVGVWLEKKNYCPMCRAPVDSISMHYISKFRYFMSNISLWAVRSLVG